MSTRYPLWLDLTGRPVLVVGGGTVAGRRLPALIDAGAVVTVVAPRVSREVRDSAAAVIEQAWTPEHLAGASLVLACTDDPAVNAAVAAAAAQRGLWCVRADDASASAAWVPARAGVGGIEVAVSGGGDPGRARAVRDAIAALLRSGDLPMRRTRRDGPGRVVLVGGGPGDADLLTLRGLRAVLDADVVVHDRLAPGGVLDLLPAAVEVVDVGKTPGGPAATQADINALLVQRARSGEVVVRLKGGDPFVFGRGSEEVAACRAAGVAVEVVPGISSATGAPALAGIPLTERGTAQLFTVASGHVPPGDPRSTVDWPALAAGGGTLVLLMAVANLTAIATTLVAHGRPGYTPAVAVVDASLPGQQVVVSRLADLAAGSGPAIRSPAVIVVGDVAGGLRPDGAGGPPL